MDEAEMVDFLSRICIDDILYAEAVIGFKEKRLFEYEGVVRQINPHNVVIRPKEADDISRQVVNLNEVIGYQINGKYYALS